MPLECCLHPASEEATSMNCGFQRIVMLVRVTIIVKVVMILIFMIVIEVIMIVAILVIPFL